MIAATSIFLALLLAYLVGAHGGFLSSHFGKQAIPQVVSATSLQRSWEDLAPPFNMERSISTSSASKYQDAWEHEHEDIIHFCFLVHGHRGLSKDLSYLQAVMQSLAEQEKRKVYLENGTVQELIVHNCVCNEGKTTDGVTNGGERLVEEMLTTIKSTMLSKNQSLSTATQQQQQQQERRQVTVSVVGNSLGGIYSRYAVAKLNSQAETELPDIELHFNIFCTTATPHLGISRHTYFPLSRSAENVVANALGDTGKDLFRLNDLMKTMATSDDFVAPLGAFRKRIAYANAYGTDFPVPAETAAFLSDQSTYPHHFSLEEQEQGDDSCDRLVVSDSGLVIATLHTPPNHDGACLNEEHEDELVRMSTRLDALGWKKVFVDIRKEVPRIAIPRRLSEGLRRSGLLGSLKSTDELSSRSNSEEDVTASIHDLKQKKVVESRDVAKSVKEDPADPYHRLHLPVGHNMIVAFSRSRISTFMNKGGRPVVDALAKELVEDIFAWDEEPEKDSS